jgi:DNA-binding response OmpR family regulator
MKKYKILVVDDEEDLCEILQFNLENEGFDITTAFSAEDALTKNIEEFDLLLLDVMMGTMSGFKLADAIRKNPQTEKTPIIFITAKDTENDTLTGFTLGADDYISKPFHIKEVVARIKAVLRRTAKKEKDESANKNIKYKELELQTEKKKVFVLGKEIEITKKEFEILKLFLEHQNSVFSREDILNRIWGDVFVTDRTVDVNITRLRKKIEPYGENIVTRMGYGYSFES